MKTLIYGTMAFAIVMVMSGIAGAEDKKASGDCDPLLSDDCYTKDSPACKQIQPCLCGNKICDKGFGENWETCPGDCKKPRKRSRVKKANVPCQVCPKGEPGEKGDIGEKGDDGKNGKDGKDCVLDGLNSPISFGLGYMGRYTAPGHTYEWYSLPALFLLIDIDDERRHEINLMGGYGPYIDGAVAFQLGYTHFFEKTTQKNGNHWLGLSLNVQASLAGLKEGVDDGTIIGGVPAVVFRVKGKRNILFRGDIGLFVGMANFDYKNDLPEGIDDFEDRDCTIGASTTFSVLFNPGYSRR